MQADRSSSKTPKASKMNSTPTLPPSGARGLKGARSISSSSPNMYGNSNVTMSLPGSSSRQVRVHPHGNTGGRTTPSLIPTPRKSGIRRPMSTTPGSSPSTPRYNREKTTPTRSASVGPEKLASQLSSRRSIAHTQNNSSSGSGKGSVARQIPRPNSAR